jgi:spore germination cell wall hydrolase CwlJ-like protein
MRFTIRRRAFSAALITALCAALPATADTGTDVARLIGHEQAGLDGAAARVSKIGEATRPRARDDDAVTVTSRSVDPKTVKELAAGKDGGPVKLSLGVLDTLPPVEGSAEHQCLEEAIYFESRGEPLEGQIAVAEVVLNRVDDRQFPNTICGVTNQGVGRGRACQFSYACDGNSDVMKSPVARDRSEKLAALMLAGRARTLTDGALYFHTRASSPKWARKMTRTNAIGHHYFYRAGTRVAGG